jgi:hypothetical protein
MLEVVNVSKFILLVLVTFFSTDNKLQKQRHYCTTTSFLYPLLTTSIHIYHSILRSYPSWITGEIPVAYISVVYLVVAHNYECQQTILNIKEVAEYYYK